MGYSEQFRAFREGRGLSREQLAAQGHCHRNTVINIESGRAVRFATLRQLMDTMGYSAESAETKLLAVLWLEAKTGIRVSINEAQQLNGGTLLQSSSAFHALSKEIENRKLRRGDLELLQFAARHRPVLNALKAIKNLVADRAQSIALRPITDKHGVV